VNRKYFKMSTNTSAAPQFISKIQAPDGTLHNSKQEAMDHMRKPQILDALKKLTKGGDPTLADWLLANQETVEVAFETGTIRRVTKSDAKKLADAVNYIKDLLSNDKKAAFVVENAGAVIDSFRWPSVKRMDDDEKTTAARNGLTAATGGNVELSNWIIANRDAILEAYDAGKIKREVSEKATAGLAEYRAKKAAEKVAAEAAKAAEAPAAESSGDAVAPV
jgi:hypothetical protein